MEEFTKEGDKGQPAWLVHTFMEKRLSRTQRIFCFSSKLSPC